jgi:rod shape-determining protein MreC
MKRTYLLIIGCIVIIVISLAFTRSKGSFSSVDSGISKVFAPIGIVFSHSTAGISNFFSSLGNIGNLQKENKQLQERVDNLEAQVATMKEQVKENESLKRELSFKQSSGFSTISAEVAFFDPTNIRETITVNKGEKDGIAKDMVVTSEGFLVGKVSEVFSATAKIALITDPLSSIPAVLNGSTLSGLVQGQVGFGL